MMSNNLFIICYLSGTHAGELMRMQLRSSCLARSLRPVFKLPSWNIE